MYVRQVSMELKSGSGIEFIQQLESEILALLRKQTGFKDEIMFANVKDNCVFALSLWDSKESAEAYSRGSYAEVARIMSEVVQGTPEVKSFEIEESGLLLNLWFAPATVISSCDMVAKLEAA